MIPIQDLNTQIAARTITAREAFSKIAERKNDRGRHGGERTAGLF